MSSVGPHEMVNRYPWWSMHCWHGMTLGPWLSLLRRHRFRVRPSRIPSAALITVFTATNSVFRIGQLALLGRRVSRTKVPRSPIFVVGHWRSGTTYLHELVSLDERFAAPTTYQCAAADHFLATEWFLKAPFGLMLPRVRPMDNVRFACDTPQEDEFALLSMGAPSPYLNLAFFDPRQDYLQYLDMRDATPEQLRRWSKSLLYFTRELNCHLQKRLVLKSPTHTARVRLLRQLFPEAKFIHIVRHPYALYPSTVKLWSLLTRIVGLQVASDEVIREYVFRAFDRMYEAFESQIAAIPPHDCRHVRYEDLVRDPVGEMERIYDTLQLGEFDRVRGSIERVTEDRKNYQAGRYQLDAATRAEVARRWRGYFERYGYRDDEGAE